ncbi:hypothetical protein ACHHYP_06727, partial [Achlya hypogyna]
KVERDLIRVKVASPKKTVWAVGSKVEARYKGKSTYYPGKITKVHSDGSCDIDYDDGEKEKRVEKDFIRLVPGATDDAEVRLRVGSKVEAKYKGKSKLYPGTIAKVHSNGTYDIDYDDGEKETNVAKELIRGSEGSPPKVRLKIGAKVEAKYKGKTFYPGKIAKVHSDGTCDVDYDDGEVELRVKSDWVRAIASADSDIEVGTKVEAKYRGKTFYPGKIAKIHSDGTCDVDYDDGEKEKKIKRELIRVLDAKKTSTDTKPGTADPDCDLDVGTKVEAKYKGRTFYPGKIAKVHSNGTYDIDYDDGEKEKKVHKDLVRVVKMGSPKKNTALKVGTKVEARYKGKSKYYPGKIAKAHSDGSYDIDYDDGEKEKRIEMDLIRVLGGENDGSGNDDGDRLAVGTNVEA